MAGVLGDIRAELVVTSMRCGGVIRGDVWVPGFP